MHSAQLCGEHIAQRQGMQAAYSFGMLPPSLRHQIRRANLGRLLEDERIGGPAQLARLMGKPKLKAHLSNLRSGVRGIGDRLAASIERAAGVPPGWMDAQHPLAGEAPAAYVLAQPVSQPPSANSLPLLSWEAIVQGRVPDVFRALLADDALAPDYPAGTEIVWTKHRRAAPGRLILVQDRHGQVHARQCRQGRSPDQWLAAPINSAYLTFDSAEEGLTLIAVYKGRLEPDD